MHHTEQITNFRFTHGPFACVPFALNDRIDPVLARDQIHTVVTLTAGLSDRIAKFAETFGAPFLEL